MKVVIVGGVAGGAGAAARLRRNDEQAEIILFERGGFVSFANCGLPYHIGGVIADEAELLLQTPESLHQRFRIDVRVQHEVITVDPVARTVTVRNLANGDESVETYDALILSPGARPVRPPLPGIDQPHVFTLRNMEDCRAITHYVQTRKPASAAVIGAGFVGLEMAENLHRLGLQLTVIEAASKVMGSLDADLAAEVHNHIRDKGVTLLLDSAAAAIGPRSVTLKTGREVPAELVLVSVGVAPDTGFLVGSGVALGPRGDILVDAGMRTSQPQVYAVGDAVSVPHAISKETQMVPLAAPANKQARLVADVVSGTPRAYAGAQGTAIAKVFDMAAAVTGMNEAALKQKKLPYAKAITQSSSHASYYPDATLLTIKLLFNPATGALYGAQAVGFAGVDKRIDVLATAMRAGMTVFDLQTIDLAYAPPFSSAKDPVNTAGYVAGNIIEGRTHPCTVDELPDLPADAIFLDIRTPEELVEEGAFAPALHSRNIPLDTLRERMHELEPGRPVYIACRVGQRAHVAEQILRHNGVEAYNLLGGFRLYQQMRRDAAARAE